MRKIPCPIMQAFTHAGQLSMGRCCRLDTQDGRGYFGLTLNSQKSPPPLHVSPSSMSIPDDDGKLLRAG